jgi:hypothetical protein
MFTLGDSMRGEIPHETLILTHVSVSTMPLRKVGIVLNFAYRA